MRVRDVDFRGIGSDHFDAPSRVLYCVSRAHIAGTSMIAHDANPAHVRNAATFLMDNSP